VVRLSDESAALLLAKHDPVTTGAILVSQARDAMERAMLKYHASTDEPPKKRPLWKRLLRI